MADSPEPSADLQASELPEIADARDKRIAELEAKLSRPPGVGIVPPVALLAFGCAVFLLYGMADDFTYYGSSRQAVELGAEGDYRLAALTSNRYAQIHGVPTGRGAYFQDSGRSMVAIGLQNTPVLVIRQTLPGEDFVPGKTAPQPDQRPFAVKGRLLARADAQKYEAAFASHAQWGEINPAWVLMAEAHPGGDTKFMVIFTAVAVFAAVNLWLALKGALSWFKPRARPGA